jgi:hypothetical protein
MPLHHPPTARCLLQIHSACVLSLSALLPRYEKHFQRVVNCVNECSVLTLGRAFPREKIQPAISRTRPDVYMCARQFICCAP